MLLLACKGQRKLSMQTPLATATGRTSSRSSNIEAIFGLLALIWSTKVFHEATNLDKSSGGGFWVAEGPACGTDALAGVSAMEGSDAAVSGSPVSSVISATSIGSGSRGMESWGAG